MDNIHNNFGFYLSALNSVNFFLHSANDNEIIVEFDNYRWIKIGCHNNRYNRWFVPNVETADVNDMVIGWNQLCNG